MAYLTAVTICTKRLRTLSHTNGQFIPSESESECEKFLWCLNFFDLFSFDCSWIFFAFIFAQCKRALRYQFAFHKCLKKLVGKKASPAMLAAKRLAGVLLEVNLRKQLHMADEGWQWGDPTWLRNPCQTSPKAQNRGISGSWKDQDPTM